MLLDLKWWDLSYRVLRDNTHILQSNDKELIKEFYQKYKK